MFEEDLRHLDPGTNTTDPSAFCSPFLVNALLAAACVSCGCVGVLPMYLTRDSYILPMKRLSPTREIQLAGEQSLPGKRDDYSLLKWELLH